MFPFITTFAIIFVIAMWALTITDSAILKSVVVLCVAGLLLMVCSDLTGLHNTFRALEAAMQ